MSFATYRDANDHKEPACLDVTALVLDIDGVKEGNPKKRRPVKQSEFDALKQWLDPYEYILYTTTSHVQEDLHIRVIIRLDKPVSARDWRHFFNNIDPRARRIVDVNTKNPNRQFYVPCNGAYIDHNIGEPLQTDPILAIAPPQGPLEAALPDGRPTCTRKDLERVRNALKSSHNTKRVYFAQVLQNVLDGVSYAPEGERDTTTFRLAYYIAQSLPFTDPTSIAAYFAESLDLMGGDIDVAAKLERQQATVLEQKKAAQATRDEAERQNLLQAFAYDPEAERDWPYTDQELTDLADNLSTDRHGLKRRWVIQHGQTYHLLTPRGYQQYHREALSNAARVHLSPASTDGVTLYELVGKDIRLKSPQGLVRDYGTVAKSTLAHLEINLSHYEVKTDTFHEAARPVNPNNLEPLDADSPEFSQIDQWIETLGGHYSTELRKWIFHVTDLSRPCVALFMTGSPGAGKNLLACGLAKLWGAGAPTPLKTATGNFNTSIMNCPLLLADEELPKDFKGNIRTEELREIIQGYERDLRRKNRDDTTLTGAVRIIIQGNNEQILKFQDQLNDDDMKAIQERLLHIDITDQATDFLDHIGHDKVRTWVNQNLIARYALALQVKYASTYKPEGRFLIKTHDTGLIYRTLGSGGVKSDVINWLVSVITEPQRVATNPQIGNYLAIHNGSIYLHAKALDMSWGATFALEQRPKLGAVRKVISGMGVRTKMPGTTIHCRRIDPMHIKAWIDTEGDEDWESFQTRLEAGVDFGRVISAEATSLDLN